ncbi:quinate 5-dehydrogenase [Oceanithermus sp.]|uniref:quinate 5-dehydrogenase n=1 Tax=Oceanithermus sp. TaxID=2268145 RepID=UPI0025D3F489|nr:quinate 5-dehydrogenase [Oceanithermus sp.]
MKRVVSVSIGSSKRNAKAEVELLGETFVLERVGTDGSFEKAIELIQRYDADPEVAAIGLGGIDLYLYAAGRRYTIRDALKLARAAKQTPVVDGSGLKHTLERKVVADLDAEIGWKGRKVVMTSAVDRFGMAEALWDHGAEMVFGDLIFGVGLPVPIRTLRGLRLLARILLPVFTRLPFKMIYPTGEKQEKQIQDWRRKYYDWAEVVAGDFLYIKRFMPDRIDGKIVLTNTTTPEDVEMLRERGAAMLVTTTPRLNGRSFGTNVMEGLFVALAGKFPLSEQDYLDYIEKLGLGPNITRFSEPS